MTLRKPRIQALEPAKTQAELDGHESKGNWHSYRCKLVTPMYGGGVEAGKVDKNMPIRASAIRGQLRFWWRVSCASSIPSEEMFQRETAIWGGIAGAGPTASKVKIRVACSPAKQSELIKSDDESDRGVKYAFGPATINGAADWLKPDYQFELYLRYPEAIRDEVLTALSWWASFGGIGARTRRGFGTILVEGKDIAPVKADAVKSLGGLLRHTGVGSGDAEKEWKKSIGKLHEFRQKGGIGRRDNKPKPGRSFWPEPDQLRRFTGKNAGGKHMPEHNSGNVFPRAAFGLPITFEFRGSPGDPQKLELHPEGGSDRMASPLILRPYWNGKTWQAAALLLPEWEKALNQPLKFKGQDGYKPTHWPADAKTRQEKARHIKPMMKGNELRADDPLSAFMHYFEKGL